MPKFQKFLFEEKYKIRNTVCIQGNNAERQKWNIESDLIHTNFWNFKPADFRQCDAEKQTQI